MLDIKHVSGLTNRKEKACIYVASEKEYEHFMAAAAFLTKELGFNEVCVFKVEDENRYDPQNRARKAKPGRPGIYIE